MKKLLIPFLFLASLAWGQGGAYTSQVIAKGNQGFLVPVSGPSIKVCTDQACTSPISLFTSETLSVGTANPTGGDSQGNYTFYAAPGAYWCQITAPGYGTATSKCDVSLAGAVVDISSNQTIGGNKTFTGNNTFTGATSISNPCSIGGLIYLSSGGCYQTLAAAISAASTGQTVIVPPGTYTQALGSITVSKPVHIQCANPTTTFIQFTGASGVAILVNYDSSGTGNGNLADIGATIENCQLIGPGGATGGVGNAGTGIQLGDPTHASVGFRLWNSQLHGFATAFSWGNPASWNFDGGYDTFSGNSQDVLYNFSSGTGCAICRFHHTAFQGSGQANAIQLAGTLGGNFVFEQCFIADDPFTISNSAGWIVALPNVDWENTVNTTSPYLSIAGGYVNMSGLSEFQQVKSSGDVPAAFIVVSGGELKVDAIYAVSSATMAALVSVSGSSNLDLSVVRTVGITNDVSGTTTGAITRQTQSSAFFGKSFASNVDFVEGGAVTNGGLAGTDRCVGDSTFHLLKCSWNNGTFYPIPQVIASGTAAMTTAAIGAGACGTTVTVSAPGTVTTDAIVRSFNAPVAANPGVLIVQSWPTADNVHFVYCNPTAGSVTPSAATLNWRVAR